MSRYLSNVDFTEVLSYEAREVACHAQEIYKERLRNKEYHYLKVHMNDTNYYYNIQLFVQIHSYRAAIEKIICNKWPHLKHSGLRSIKYTKEFTFEEYCRIAVPHLCIKIPAEEIHSSDTIMNLKNWRKIIIFYTLRIFLAPLVESLVHYDRLLCLLENGKKFSKFSIKLIFFLFVGCTAAIQALFEPTISPRNQILMAYKNNKK